MCVCRAFDDGLIIDLTVYEVQLFIPFGCAGHACREMRLGFDSDFLFGSGVVFKLEDYRLKDRGSNDFYRKGVFRAPLFL